MRLEPLAPPLASFIALRAAEGWGTLSEDAARRSVAGGLINATLHDGDTLVGFGRVVGDGVLYFYIQDLIIAPAFRGQGHGRRILADLVARTRQVAAPGAVIGLMSASGREGFYESFGFVGRPNERYGAGMMLGL